MAEPVYALAGKRVYVAGHRGMVGQAICRRLEREDCTVLTAGRKDADLTRQAEAEDWMAENKPDAVFVAAAKVGGILANDSFPADFLYENLMIEANVIHASHRSGVEKLMFLGSSCIYPKLAEQPMREDALLTGRWSRRTSGTRLPRSPASSCARPIASSTGRISSRRCRRTCMARATITISRPVMFCRR